MCLALPARIVERLPDEQAWVELGGLRKSISLALVPEAQIGDWAPSPGPEGACTARASRSSASPRRSGRLPTCTARPR